jgi:hypothetical protein
MANEDQHFGNGLGRCYRKSAELAKRDSTELRDRRRVKLTRSPQPTLPLADAPDGAR